MKNHYLKGVSMVAAAAVVFASCKTTDWSKVKHEVTPNPLELHADSVIITVKGTVPPKIFRKRTTVTLTPTIKWNGGEKALKPVVFDGEKIKNGAGSQVFVQKEGGSFTYKDVVAYQPEMKAAELVAKAVVTKKKKSKSFDIPKFADATIITPLLAMSDEKPVFGKENMPRVVNFSKDADIHYVISQSDVRATETKQADVTDMVKFVKDSKTDIMDEKGKTVVSTKENYIIKGIGVSAYASPDGEQDKNANLASDRANSSAKYVWNEIKKMKMDAGKDEATFFAKTSTPEDWDGFKSLMEASTIADKDMIIRIISMNSDLDKRETEIKNISKVYTEIADNIMPQLRRSKMSVSAEKPCKTDAELAQMSASTPDSLNVEELIYAGEKATDLNVRLAIYQAADRLFSSDWRGANNAGCVLIMQNKVSDASAMFDKANAANPNNPIILNNLGVIAMKKGDRKAAENYFKSAGGSSESSYNLGRINILNGLYSEAVNNYGSNKSFNAALAKLLNKDNDGAMSTIEESNDKETGMGYYLKAVICARKGDNSGVVNNLKSAIAKDNSLKSAAKDDREFIKLFDDAGFKSTVN